MQRVGRNDDEHELGGHDPAVLAAVWLVQRDGASRMSAATRAFRAAGATETAPAPEVPGSVFGWVQRLGAEELRVFLDGLYEAAAGDEDDPCTWARLEELFAVWRTAAGMPFVPVAVEPGPADVGDEVPVPYRLTEMAHAALADEDDGQEQGKPADLTVLHVTCGLVASEFAAGGHPEAGAMWDLAHVLDPADVRFARLAVPGGGVQ
ncbi:MAG: hypothetical protein LC792_05100 [Actinobacteria bacterium]|nr:hypothetical protein [Actinomycetota bacterium]